MDNRTPINKEDAISSLKIAFHALIRSGLSLEEIVDLSNSILQVLIESDEITLLSTGSLGMVKDEFVNKLGDISFDTLRNTIFFGDRRVKLSPNESLLMNLCINNPGKLLTHEEIVSHVVGDTNSSSSPAEICRPIISRLRSNLATFPDGEKWIETVRGKGYVFRGNKGI